MLEYQKERFAKRFANYTLKADPYVLRLAGYNPQETTLKIDNYYLHCIPATLSLKNCNLLLSLRDKEKLFFDEFKGSLISLNFAFSPAYFNKNTSFYLKGRFESIKLIRNGVYNLVFSIMTISNSYTELFYYLSDVVTLHNKLYERDLTKDEEIKLTPKPFSDVKIYSGTKLVCSESLLDITTKSFEINTGESVASITAKDQLHYEINCNGKIFRLSGSLIETTDTNSKFSLNFNTEYIHTLSRLIRVYKNKDNYSVDSEIEEL